MVDDQHRPDPAFLSKLEWQVTTQWRRLDRKGQPGPAAVFRRWQIASLVAVSALAGVAVVKAADAWEGSRNREIESARAVAAADLAAERLELVRELQRREESAWNEGQVDEAALLTARLEAERVELEAALRRSELEEVERTGRPARSAIDSPLVAGRDFVAERLALEAAGVEKRVATAGRVLDAARRRFDEGRVPEAELARAKGELDAAEREAERLRGLIELRRSYADGQLAAVEVVARTQLLDARSQMTRAEAEMREAAQALERAESAWAAGSADQRDRMQAQLERHRAALQLELARMELELQQRGVSR